MNDPKSAWSIAIHGGAGGDPFRLDETLQAARIEGLRRALQAGVDLLRDGRSAIDVVEAVVVVLENDSNFNAGRGSVLTDKGVAELDAAIMDGRTLGCGAIAGVKTVKNPISLARLLMSQTPHVLLAGQAADEFAAGQDIVLVRPDYFTNLETDYEQSPPHFGTVGCVVRDGEGNLAAGTSTGGTTKKLPGRVGDSPIIGAGTFAANDSCAVSGTGVGEEYIRAVIAYDIAAQMRYGQRSLAEAVDDNITRRLRPDTGGLIAVSNDGSIVLRHNTPGMNCGWADGAGTFEIKLSLL